MSLRLNGGVSAVRRRPTTLPCTWPLVVDPGKRRLASRFGSGLLTSHVTP